MGARSQILHTNNIKNVSLGPPIPRVITQDCYRHRMPRISPVMSRPHSQGHYMQCQDGSDPLSVTSCTTPNSAGLFLHNSMPPTSPEMSLEMQNSGGPR